MRYHVRERESHDDSNPWWIAFLCYSSGSASILFSLFLSLVIWFQRTSWYSVRRLNLNGGAKRDIRESESLRVRDLQRCLRVSTTVLPQRCLSSLPSYIRHDLVKHATPQYLPRVWGDKNNGSRSCAYEMETEAWCTFRSTMTGSQAGCCTAFETPT